MPEDSLRATEVKPAEQEAPSLAVVSFISHSLVRLVFCLYLYGDVSLMKIMFVFGFLISFGRKTHGAV